MSVDDTEKGEDTHGSAWSSGGDPVRDLLLGLAAQIDQVAGVIGGLRPSTFGAGEGLGATPGAAAGAVFGGLAEASGEISALLAEIGDLLARLIAALIAVLEAIMAALQSTPSSDDAAATRTRYEPIVVRMDTGGENS